MISSLDQISSITGRDQAPLERQTSVGLQVNLMETASLVEPAGTVQSFLFPAQDTVHSSESDENLFQVNYL